MKLASYYHNVCSSSSEIMKFPSYFFMKGAPGRRRGLFPLSYNLFQAAPPFTSVTSMPCRLSSSRIRSASAKFFAFFAS